MTNELSQEDALVQQLAAPIIHQHKKSLKFGSRNRSAWNRMNRPDKIAKIEKGSSFLLSFFERCQPKKPEEVLETP